MKFELAIALVATLFATSAVSQGEILAEADCAEDDEECLLIAYTEDLIAEMRANGADEQSIAQQEFQLELYRQMYNMTEEEIEEMNEAEEVEYSEAALQAMALHGCMDQGLSMAICDQTQWVDTEYTNEEAIEICLEETNGSIFCGGKGNDDHQAETKLTHCESALAEAERIGGELTELQQKQIDMVCKAEAIAEDGAESEESDQTKTDDFSDNEEDTSMEDSSEENSSWDEDHSSDDDEKAQEISEMIQESLQDSIEQSFAGFDEDGNGTFNEVEMTAGIKDILSQISPKLADQLSGTERMYEVIDIIKKGAEGDVTTDQLTDFVESVAGWV